MKTVMCLWCLLACVRLAAAEPDFRAAADETLARIQELVRLDTRNPPGGETQVAAYLQDVLRREGLEAELLARDPARANLVVRLRGSGRKRPVLLMAHTDVVGVERGQWTVDPFAGVIKDGYLYGRGASDDKSMVAAFLQVVLMLHRARVPLDRDVIFAAVADEEGSAVHGIRFLAAEHWDRIACEFALNEGGNTVEEGGQVRYVGVATTEKVPRTVFLSAKGTSAHASRPRLDNPITHLAAAVARVGEWQAPLRLNDTTRAYFAGLARVSPPDEAWCYAHLEDPVVGPQAQEIIRRTDPVTNAMLRTTVSPTVIKGGFRANVVPGDALATLDVRLLPGEDLGELLDRLRALIADPAVDVVPAEADGREAAPPSRLDTAMYAALDRARQRAYPGSLTLPIMATGATDSAYLRPRGVQVYGVRSAAEPATGGARPHGNDERLKIDGLRPFLELVYRAVADVAAAP